MSLSEGCLLSIKMLRILHVVPSIGRQSGGLTSSVIGLAAGLQDSNVETTIHTTDAATPPQAQKPRRGLTPADLPDRFDELSIEIHPLSHPYRLSFAPHMMTALRSTSEKVDLVHIHGLFLYPQFAAFKAAMASGTPFIVSTHGMLHPHFQQRGKLRKRMMELLWQGQMLRRSAVLHATSEVERSALDQLAYGPPIQVIPNGISTNTYAKASSGKHFRSAHGIPFETPVILTHGRIAPVKGLDVLINALPKVLELHPHARLVIVGPDDDGLTPVLRRRADNLGVSDSIIFVGALHGEQLVDAIHAADVWALLSHSDSFGLAALEALASGRAVVASRHVDLASDAAEHDALVMVDTNPIEAGAAISGLLDSKEQRRQMGERAQLYSQRFDWPNVAREFIDLYDNVLQRSR